VPGGTVLATYLHARSDDERARLARELHDDLGGLLVAAKIDLNHLEQGHPVDPAAVTARLGRVRDSLDAAIALNRRLIEALHPGLLVHIGLCAALRWHVEDACLQAGRSYRLDLPEDELALKPETGLALYRIAQDALARALADSGHEPLEVTLAVHDGILEMSFAGTPAAAARGVPSDPALLSMRHRIAGLGGTLVSDGRSAGARLSVRLPLVDHQIF
jgi:signal transduction histidine kinase